MLKASLAALTVCTSIQASPAIPDDRLEDLAFGFCYSITAMGWCNGILVSGNTAKKIRAILPPNFERIGGSDYSDNCLAGSDAAWDEEAKGTLCESAWTSYGCGGEIVANILSQSALFTNPPQLCDLHMDELRQR